MLKLIAAADKAAGLDRADAMKRILERAEMLTTVVLRLGDGTPPGKLVSEVKQARKHGYRGRMNLYHDMWRRELNDFVIYQAVEAFRKQCNELLILGTKVVDGRVG